MAGLRGRPPKAKVTKPPTDYNKVNRDSDNKPAPRKAKVEQITIVPVKKHKSGYIFEGTGIALETTHRTWIPIYDTIRLSEDLYLKDELIAREGENIEIRHIRGVTSPYVLVQNRLGSKPTRDDSLFIEDGFKTFRNQGHESSAYNYLVICNYNADNPNRLEDSVHAIFKQFSVEADAAVFIGMDEKLFRAKQVVYELKTGQDEYNHDALKFYQRVFGLGGSSDVEIFKSFTLLAAREPDLVINGIEQEQAVFLEIITRAFEQNLIVLDEAGVISTRRKQYIINTEEQVSRAMAEEKLIEYFSSESGSLQYQQLKAEVGEFADAEI